MTANHSQTVGGTYEKPAKTNIDVASANVALPFVRTFLWNHCGVCERFGGRYGRVVHGVRHRLGAPTVDDAQLERLRRMIAEL